MEEKKKELQECNHEWELLEEGVKMTKRYLLRRRDKDLMTQLLEMEERIFKIRKKILKRILNIDSLLECHDLYLTAKKGEVEKIIKEYLKRQRMFFRIDAMNNEPKTWERIVELNNKEIRNCIEKFYEVLIHQKSLTYHSGPMTPIDCVD